MYGRVCTRAEIGREDLGRIVQVLEVYPVAMALKRLGSLSAWHAVFVQESRFLSLEGL